MIRVGILLQAAVDKKTFICSAGDDNYRRETRRRRRGRGRKRKSSRSAPSSLSATPGAIAELAGRRRRSNDTGEAIQKLGATRATGRRVDTCFTRTTLLYRTWPMPYTPAWLRAKGKGPCLHTRKEATVPRRAIPGYFVFWCSFWGQRASWSIPCALS